MKHIIIFLAAIIACSCDKEVNCNSGIGASTLVDGEGTVVCHPGFNRLVIRYHIPGTIDSFNTYIPCNLSADYTAGMEIQFKGNVQPLDEKNEPTTQIAGEEFFVLLITYAEEVI